MVLTNTEVRAIWRALYRKGEGKAEIKADVLPSRAELLAIFQAMEDWFEGERATVKGLLDTAAGRTLSNPAAKKFARGFFQWKWRRE